MQAGTQMVVELAADDCTLLSFSVVLYISTVKAGGDGQDTTMFGNI